MDNDKKVKAKEKIEKFIQKRGYTYNVSNILETYVDYYAKGYYISHTMEDCIGNLETEIVILLGEEKKQRNT